MGGKSDYLELKLLDGVYGGPAFSPPATVYIGLFTVSPSDGGGGTEVSGGSYARAAVTNNATNFPAAVGGTKQNGTAITFPTASGAWGTVVAFALFDAPTGGNMLHWGAISPTKAVGIGDTPSFAPTTLTITED